MSVIITGASDDLIEIDGDIVEEFNFFPDDDKDTRLLAFSDGTLLQAFYDKNGIWRFNPIAKGTATFHKDDGWAATDENDRVILSDVPIQWVVLGYESGMAKKQATP